MKYPRVLIVSSQFTCGDAVTGLNLFSKWEKSCLFCTSLSISEGFNSFQSCYKLGRDEIKYRFPFNLIYKSGPSVSDYKDFDCKKRVNRFDKSLLRFFIYVIKYVGLFEYRRNIIVSEKFRKWILDISPDYIYTSVSRLENAKFILRLMQEFPQIKFIIHGYDDWMIVNYDIFSKRFIYNQSDKLLKRIFKQSSINFATTNKMAIDYETRYNRKFTFIPNPVELLQNTTIKTMFNVLFIGKIAKHNFKSIKLMASALNVYNLNNKIKLSFELYTNVDNSTKEELLKINPLCNFHDWVKHEEIAQLIADSKILFIPISIDNDTVQFAKYSMSTKMSEFLSSSRPFIYCGPNGIAMTELLLKNECAFVITENKIDNLVNSINYIMEDNSIVSKYIKNAQKVYNEYFNKDMVVKEFTDTIVSHYNKSL